MTPRITLVDPATATGRAGELLAAVKAKMGATPNLTRIMAHSPAVLEGYLGLSGALAGGVLPAKAREQLALSVGEANGCDYCVSAHSFLGKKAGLTDAAVTDARRGTGDALLAFARTVLDRRGQVTDADLQAARTAGHSDAEIVEAVGHVALNVLTNFLNNVAHTPIDFPKAASLADKPHTCAAGGTC